MNTKILPAVVLGLVISFGAATAWAQVSVPNSFTAGQPASAAEVNANFQALVIAANAAPQIVVVSAVADDATASGQRLFEALAAITDATATKPYLVKVGPGTFDLGSQSLTMREYVDIEGSGADVINLTTGGTVFTSSGAVTIVGAKHTGLRMLTIQSTGGTAISLTGVLAAFGSLGPGVKLTDLSIVAGGTGTFIGILNDNSSPLIRDVTMRVTGDADVTGVHIQNGSSPILERVTMVVSSSASSATAIGVFNDSTNASSLGATIRGSTISATSFGGGAAPSGVGISNEGKTVTVEHSFISGNLNSVRAVSGDNVVQIAASRLSGPGNDGAGGGTITCFSVYDTSFLTFSCPSGP